MVEAFEYEWEWDMDECPEADEEYTKQVRELNDEFRKTFNGGIKVVTEGVRSLGPNALSEIFRKVKDYSDFMPEDDPYGEHDFGTVQYKEDKIYWKIDYYDPGRNHHSLNKADPSATTRVLTIMMSWEY